MKKFLLVILSLGYLNLSAQRKNIVFEQTFDYNVGVWFENYMVFPYSANVSKSIQRLGGGSLQVNLKKEDNYRAEFGTDPQKALPEEWVGFSVFLPSSFLEDVSAESVVQFHAYPDFNLGEQHISPPILLGVLNDHFILDTRTDSNTVTVQGNFTFERIDLGLAAKNSWTDFVFHIKWAYNNTGILELWKNGKLVYSRLNKPNSYNDKLYPYFKCGIYKWDWAGVSNSVTTERLLYIDEVRIGNEKARYCDVSPETLAKPNITGSIRREQWNNIDRTRVNYIPFQITPSSTSQLTSFEGPLNIADNYGSRIRGYIYPPQTGTYTFWLATDDAGELWLSTDSTVVNKARIANVDGWTNYQEWGKYASQKSVEINLQAGKKYYIEALQKEADGGDNLSVQWKLPDGTMETPIAGIHLSPYVDTTSITPVILATGSGSISRDEWDSVGGTNISDIPITTAPSSTGTLTSFEGPLDIADNYGSRIYGYIFPPQTGDYTFWIATDDTGELSLSTDDNPANKTKIANVDGWTNYREWGKYPLQKSGTISLQAGKKYYIEALQKEAGGGDNLSVQWKLPDGTMETPIAGIHLSPYFEQQLSTSSFAASSITGNDLPLTTTGPASVIGKTGLFVYPNPVSLQTNVEFTLPEAGQTNITLFNTKGQLIDKLFNGLTEANIKNSLILNTSKLQNGLYLIHLQSGKSSLTKKLIVMKQNAL